MTENGDRCLNLDGIWRLAEGFHDELCSEFGRGQFGKGGCLLLGKFYGASDRIYFAPNPGDVNEPDWTLGIRKDGSNPPFDSSEEGIRAFAYWRNWNTFLRANPALKKWFNNSVTSAFLIPWRTSNLSDLARLNRRTDGKIYCYAAQLVERMLSDHDARVVVVAGECTLKLFDQLTGNPRVPYPGGEGPGRVYQWTAVKRKLKDGRLIQVIQMPHFSRANSLSILGVFADWFTRQFPELASPSQLDRPCHA